MTPVINRTKIFGNKLVDFHLIIEKGFVRVTRQYRKYLFGIPTWSIFKFVEEEKKEGNLTLHRPRNFQNREGAVTFINRELEAIGSAKRYTV